VKELHPELNVKDKDLMEKLLGAGHIECRFQ